jgi:hypothetical protein
MLGISSTSKSVLLALAIGVYTAGVGLPSHAYEIASPPFVIAEQSISDDTTQDAQQSPDYVPQDPAAAAAAQDPNLAARRAQMIQACEDNNGTDCATQVDTELGAERTEAGGVRHFAPR